METDEEVPRKGLAIVIHHEAKAIKDNPIQQRDGGGEQPSPRTVPAPQYMTAKETVRPAQQSQKPSASPPDYLAPDIEYI